KIDELELKLDALDRDIQQLFHVIRGSSSQSAQKLSDIGKKVEEGHEKIKTAHEYIGSGAAVKNSGGDSGSFAMYFLVFVIGGLAVYAFSVVIRMRRDKAPKKFI
ncbi:hypothetical protein HDU99_006266, partial [Rhizoclosmatium hyalinum]